MKKMKRIASLLLAMVMILSLATTAFADQVNAGINENQGKITINNAVKDETYSIYQIFELESWQKDTAYAYTITTNSPWYKFVTEGAGKDYVNLNENDFSGIYVTWTEGADAAAFAWAAMEYAENNSIDAASSVTATGTTVEFEGVSLGYYLVDTTLGTLCSLNTTANEVVIREKNAAPTIEKTVKEDSKEGETDEYGDKNTAQVGDTVEFKTVVTAYKGAENYVVHDTMSDGFSFLENSVVIKVGDVELDSDDYSVVTEKLDECKHEPIEGSGCTFHIEFTKTYLDTIGGTAEAPTEIEITYSAILNKDAEMYDATKVTNTNDTKLTYADDNETEVAHTDTYTYYFDLVKTDVDNVLLDGAEFDLYDAATEGTKFDIVKEQKGIYRIATAAEKAVAGFESASIEVKEGKVIVEGLDADTTYYLEETKAPNGYNQLKDRVEVIVAAGEGEENPNNLVATIDNNAWTDGGVRVINNTGSLLPSTGGMGTTLIYVIGSIMVLGAAVLLIAKKRTSADK